MRNLKHMLVGLFSLALAIIAVPSAVLACTTIYVGGNNMEDGVPVVARSEDYTNSRAKMWTISEAGTFKEGDLYIGCRDYGAFEWTWSHDSYRFISFKADNEYDPEGRCPECGEPGHPSYTESGTNEMGLTVSATETLSGNGKVNGRNVDPMVTKKVDGKVGIEESDIPTVLLSEAASAREALDLLLYIYDNYGCYYASGLFVADQNEIWYIENCSGTQYVALKLNDDIMFLEPNMSVIGEIDLDDTENVIASDRLIEVAKLAGTFVGDEEENIINYRASYSRLGSSSKNRLSNGINFINGTYGYTESDLNADNTLYTISNLDADGAIVPLYTNIEADRALTVDDIVNYYKVDGIANTGNTDTAFFQIYKASDRPVELGTVEWTSMSHGAYNVFIPNYPLLMDDTYEGYKAAVGEAQKNVVEKPESGLFYRTSATGKYTVLPENWEKSFYWCFDALSNYILYAQYDGPAVTEDQVAYVLDHFADVQKEIYSQFDQLNKKILGKKKVDSPSARNQVTKMNEKASKLTHETALAMVNYLKNGDTDLDVAQKGKVFNSKKNK